MKNAEMKPWDAARLLNITGEFTKEDVDKAFKAMARRYHPDVNDSPTATEMMQSLNEARKVLLDNVGKFTAKVDDNADYGEKLSKVIYELDHLPDLDLEIRGIWLWVSGRSDVPGSDGLNNPDANEAIDRLAAHGEVLAAAGVRTHKVKNESYYAPVMARRRYRQGGGNMDRDRIRSRYGSVNVGRRSRPSIG